MLSKSGLAVYGEERKYTRNFLTTWAQIEESEEIEEIHSKFLDNMCSNWGNWGNTIHIEVYEVLRWGGQSAHIQILVDDNIDNRLCTDTGREDLAFFSWIKLQGITQNLGSLHCLYFILLRTQLFSAYILKFFHKYLFKTLRSIVLLNAKEKVCLEKASFQYIGFGFVPRSTRTEKVFYHKANPSFHIFVIKQIFYCPRREYWIDIERVPSVNRKSLILLVRLYYHATFVTVWMKRKKKVILGDFRRKIICLIFQDIKLKILSEEDPA